MLGFSTCLKKKIENNSTWESAFYQSDWVKITQVEFFSFFHFICAAVNESGLFFMARVIFIFFHYICAAANASKLFFMAHLANNERFL